MHSTPSTINCWVRVIVTRPASSQPQSTKNYSTRSVNSASSSIDSKERSTNELNPKSVSFAYTPLNSSSNLALATSALNLPFNSSSHLIQQSSSLSNLVKVTDLCKSNSCNILAPSSSLSIAANLVPQAHSTTTLATSTAAQIEPVNIAELRKPCFTNHPLSSPSSPSTPLSFTSGLALDEAQLIVTLDNPPKRTSTTLYTTYDERELQIKFSPAGTASLLFKSNKNTCRFLRLLQYSTVHGNINICLLY